MDANSGDNDAASVPPTSGAVPEIDEDAVKAIAWMLSRHTLPLALKLDSGDLPWERVERATLTLIWTGYRHVFVTCYHVLNRLLELRKRNPSAEMVAYTGSGNGLMELTGFRLIDADQRSLDVALFGGLEDRVSLPGLQFIDYHSSYLADPVPGDFASIVGYPGANINVTTSKASFGYMHLGLPVSCASDKRIVLADEHGTRDFRHYENPTCRGIPLGGLSGSPAFVYRNGQPRFVGVVTDSSDRDQTIFVSRLGCINADGTLNRNLIPR
jgi:hypothetical protein